MDGRDPVGPDAKEKEPEKQPTHPTEPVIALLAAARWSLGRVIAANSAGGEADWSGSVSADRQLPDNRTHETAPAGTGIPNEGLTT
ncbi:hypothetical protein OG418_29305 [Streptomyces phaeochromogenes]|uniref:hypothetical protein n=1 Tax=Streptomyces phaeochromogenes TaxID=1923 RepID=UPI002E153A25|nr:hypothetical protein OG437_28400 [Streptomyces phaeochromogenes]